MTKNKMEEDSENIGYTYILILLLYTKMTKYNTKVDPEKNRIQIYSDSSALGLLQFTGSM